MVAEAQATFFAIKGRKKVDFDQGFLKVYKILCHHELGSRYLLQSTR